MGANLEHRARPTNFSIRAPPKSRVEKSGIVHVELAHRWIVGDHLGGILWRHTYPALGCE